MLSEAINSVLKQTYRDYELIVVDDGSTDHTEQVTASFQDSRIRYFKQAELERGAARNQGIALSQANYVTFLDDDDWFMTNKLDVQIQELQQHPEIGMVISGWERVNELGKVVRSEQPWLHHPVPALQDWLFAAMAHVAAILIRRSWLEQVGGFNKDLAPNEDTDLWFRLAQAGCKTAWVEEIVFRQRLHSSNSVRNMAYVKKGKIAMLDTIYADQRASAFLGMSKDSACARVYMGLACLQYAAGSTEDAKTDLLHATELDPSLLLNDADRLLESIAAYAWNHLTENPSVYINRVFSNLPEKLSYIRALRRKAVARMWMVGAFRAFQYQDLPGVQQRASKAILAAPSSLLNPGLRSILARSLLPSHLPNSPRAGNN